MTPQNRNFLELKNPSTINDCWIAVSDVTDLTGVTNEEIVQACCFINEICARKFNGQESDVVFNNTKLFCEGETQFFLPNIPVKSISDVYIQVNGNFTLLPVESYFFIPSTGILYIQSCISNCNLWVRYHSGYRTNGDTTGFYPIVDGSVKRATILAVSFLREMRKNGIVESYSTQTYSQKNAEISKMPLFKEIEQLLKSFKKYNYA